MHATFDLVLRVLWWWFLLVGHPWVSSSNSWGSAETSFINRSLAIAHQPYSPKPLILRPQMSRTIEPDPESNNPGRQSIYCAYTYVSVYIYTCVCVIDTLTHIAYTYIHTCMHIQTYIYSCMSSENASSLYLFIGTQEVDRRELQRLMEERWAVFAWSDPLNPKP